MKFLDFLDFLNSLKEFNDLIRFFELYYNKNIKINFIKNPYNFYQNHTLCEIDETLYKPIFDLKNGVKNYLDLMNKSK